MKKISLLLPFIFLALGIKPAFSQVSSLSDWRVPVPLAPIPHWRGKVTGAPSSMSFPELLETLPSIPDGAPPDPPAPKKKRVSDADDAYVANLVKNAVAKLNPCCCCCCTPKPAPRKKRVKSTAVTHRKKVARVIKKRAVKRPVASANKVKIRYKIRYRYIPYSCNCTPGLTDTAKAIK